MSQQEYKRDIQTISITPSAMKLGKELARRQCGNENEIKRIIETLIEKEFYSNNDTKSSFDIPIILEKFIQHFDEQLKQMHQSLSQRNTHHADRLAGLITIANFESTLTEQMIQNKYYCDERSRNIYEEIRKTISQTMIRNLEQSDATVILQLTDKIRILEPEIAILHEKIDAVEKSNNSLRKRYTNLTDINNKTITLLKASSSLIEWYEKRDREVPVLRKKNSGLIFQQSWKDALSEFVHYHPKPEVPEFQISQNDPFF